MAKALHKYINTKRARVAGAAAAATGNAGASVPVQTVVAARVVNTHPSASPSRTGNNAASAAQRAGATPLQITAAAAGAAQQQALGQNRGTNAAQQAGAEAAAAAAQQARPNASAAQQAQTAAAGAAAANVNAKRAALEALLIGVTNNNITNPNLKSIEEVKQLKENLEALNINNNRKKAVLNLINSRLRENVVQSGSGKANINSLRGAVTQNTSVMNQARATEELRRLNLLLIKVGQVNNENLKRNITNYRRRLNAKVNPAPSRRQARGSSLLRQAASAQTQRPATSPNLEKTVKAPNGRSIVVIRANKNARWNFKNDENKSKYNLRNRNKNEPVVYEVNVNSGNLFKQANEGAVQTPRALGGFAAPTLPQTAANQAAITGSLSAANKILALSNGNLQATNVNNLRANMNSLKSNVRRFRPGFSNEGANTVKKAVQRLASEINRRG
jgi:hypothetical protein